MNDVTETDTYCLHHGRAPLLVSVPHAGTQLPPSVRSALLPLAQTVPDTDWHLDQIYAFARTLGASLLVPRYSRYVVDLNRPPDDAAMYTGSNNTGLCPIRSFAGEPLYADGTEPTQEHIAARREQYWQPYHQALRSELDRLRAAHGQVLLWEGHSIKSELPWLFEGRLPDLNLGTASGNSCAPQLRAQLAQVLTAQQSYTQVVDGRFKGGYITRHYGQPDKGVHAVQLEMVLDIYLQNEASPWALDTAKCALLHGVLQALLAAGLDWVASQGRAVEAAP